MRRLTATDLEAALVRGDALVPVAAAAAAVGVGRTCVHQWVARGALACVVDGTGRTLVLLDDVAEVEHATRATRRGRRRRRG